MFKSTLTLCLLPLLALASPQYGGYGGGGSSPATTSSAPATSAPVDTAGHVNVQVAAGGNLVFSPANVTASNGTQVSFFFPSALQHSVTQSTFANPCTPLTGSNGTGFDSGLTTSTEFTITITDDTKPIWFFCKAPTHCGAGMVGSINAASTGNTFDKFQAAAKAIGSSEQTVQDSGAVTGGVGAVATAGPTSSGASAAPSPTSSGSSSSSGAGRVAVSSGVGLIAVAVAFAIAA